METKIVKLNKELLNCSTEGIQMQNLMRLTPLNEWLNKPKLSDRLSGTLKKNAKLGFKHYSQLEHEAICQTLGWGFEIIPTTYLTFNDAITEGDCHPLTEAGWHFDRMLAIHIYPEDIFEIRYINIQDQEGNLIRQGVGIIVKQTSIQWIKKGSMCFALLTEYDIKTKQWTDCLNPF
jgi:hypothetical protein